MAGCCPIKKIEILESSRMNKGLKIEGIEKNKLKCGE